MIDFVSIMQITKVGLGLIFYLTILIFIGFTLSLIYHWFAYGIHKTRILTIIAIYLIVSALLLLAMSLTLNAI